MFFAVCFTVLRMCRFLPFIVASSTFMYFFLKNNKTQDARARAVFYAAADKVVSTAKASRQSKRMNE